MEDEFSTPPTLRLIKAELAFPPRDSHDDVADPNDASFFNLSPGEKERASTMTDIPLFTEEPADLASQAADDPIDRDRALLLAEDVVVDEVSPSLVQSLRNDSPRNATSIDGEIEDERPDEEIEDGRKDEEASERERTIAASESLEDDDEIPISSFRPLEKSQSKPIPISASSKARQFEHISFSPEPLEERGSSLSEETMLAKRMKWI
jgi:hypothetical protein